jgi:transcriptional regulator GlxA family with amidase domain
MQRTFSDQEVMDILQSTQSITTLARFYQVGYHVIYNIKTGRTYQHLTSADGTKRLRNTDSETSLDLVRANYSLSAIAEFTGLSARAIGRLWLRETGMTIREYRRLHQVRYGDKISG